MSRLPARRSTIRPSSRGASRFRQPAVKLDYQATSALRVSYKYSGWRQKEQAVPGTLPGFNDTIMSHPVVYTWAASGNYTLNKTTFIEATVGRSMLELVGCGPATNGSAPVFCQTAIPVSAAANPANSGLGDLPYLFPDAGVLSPDTHMAWLLDRVSSPVYGNGIVSVLPTFAWGSRIANAPPNVPYPSGGGMNQVISRNVVGSLTKLAGSHTIKIGYYQDHTSKIQTSAAGTGSNAFRGGLSFANNTNNAIDSTFGTRTPRWASSTPTASRARSSKAPTASSMSRPTRRTPGA